MQPMFGARALQNLSPLSSSDTASGFEMATSRRMSRAQVLEQLAQTKPILATRFGVTRLALFGSTARGNAGVNSDIDVLVAFDGPATSERYFGVQFELEDLLGRPVDLVTDKALRPELRATIESEAVDV